MRRWCQRLSPWVIGIATVGFACLTLYDWHIKTRESDLQNEQRQLDIIYRETVRGTTDYQLVSDWIRHIELLQALKADARLINDSMKHVEQKMKDAILITNPGEQTAKEIANLHSYQELLPVFAREQKSSVTRANEITVKIASLKNEISWMEWRRNLSYTIFLILNTVGLVLSLSFKTPDTYELSRADRRRNPR